MHCDCISQAATGWRWPVAALPPPKLVAGAVSHPAYHRILYSLHLFNEHLYSTYNVLGTVSFENINSHTYLNNLMGVTIILPILQIKKLR